MPFLRIVAAPAPPSITGAATTYESGSISAYVGEVKSVAITCNQAIESLALEAVFETLRSTGDIATVGNSAIAKSGTSATFTVPSEATSVERTLKYSIRRTDTGESVASGLLFVTITASGD